jgi:hypothetical protein
MAGTNSTSGLEVLHEEEPSAESATLILATLRQLGLSDEDLALLVAYEQDKLTLNQLLLRIQPEVITKLGEEMLKLSQQFLNDGESQS